MNFLVVRRLGEAGPEMVIEASDLILGEAVT
jgi:hypothetical protein